MIRHGKRFSRFKMGMVVGVIVAMGCGGEKPAPKDQLTTDEQQQVKDLNQQRQSEWAPKPAKK